MRARGLREPRWIAGAVLCLCAVSGRVARGQECQPYWAYPGGAGLPHVTLAGWLLPFDDGTGNALYFAAGFNNTGDVYHGAPVWRRRAREWEPVGSWPDNYRGSRLSVLDDGSGAALYLDVTFNYQTLLIRKWTGAEWVDGPPGFFQWHYPNPMM